MSLASPRRWSILLWVVALAIGFGLNLRKVPPWHVAILVIVPAGEAGADTAREVSEAVDNEAGEQGVTPELRVLTRRRDAPADRADLERLGFAPSDDVVMGVVECDEADRPIRVVDHISVRDPYSETAVAAVRSARQWADR